MKGVELFDLHIHTPFSDGQWDVDTVVRGLIKVGVKVAGFADHLFPFAMYFHGKRKLERHKTPGLARMYSAERLRYRKAFIRALDRKYPQIRLLNGAEVDAYPHGGLSLPRGISPDFFDYLLVSKHHTLPKPLNLFKKFPKLDRWSWAHSPRKRLMRCLWYKGLAATFRRFHPDVFAHPQEGMPKYMTTADYARLVHACKNNGVALELNHFPLEEHEELLLLARERGVKFSLASDFHGFSGDVEGALAESRRMYELAGRYGLELIDPGVFVRRVDGENSV
ncbi:MAG: PHP domain-containing protein [Promethearchaeota archaeon]